MQLVVLSPHLDDAVFSCGGQIARAVAAGEQVLVATFGTRAPPRELVPKKLWLFMDYETRLAEDRAALACLGASGRALGFVERIFRSPAFRSLPRVYRTPGTLAGFDCLHAMQQTIRGLASEFPGALLYAPLAIGNHVDHVELFLAALFTILEDGLAARFRFYEDAYGLGLPARRRHFIARERLWPVLRAPERTSPRTWLMFKVLALAMRGPPLESYLPAAGCALRWSYATVPIGEHESTKLEAACAYRSQVKELGGPAVWCEVLRRGHRVFESGTAVEPLWVATPGDEPTFEMTTRPDAVQARAIALTDSIPQL